VVVALRARRAIALTFFCIEVVGDVVAFTYCVLEYLLGYSGQSGSEVLIVRRGRSFQHTICFETPILHLNHN
jgi:hypothetical protein